VLTASTDPKTDTYAKPVTVRDALTHLQDITLPASRDAVAVLSQCASDATERRTLAEMALLTPESKVFILFPFRIRFRR
jgi:hypothetical protein